MNLWNFRNLTSCATSFQLERVVLPESVFTCWWGAWIYKVRKVLHEDWYSKEKSRVVVPYVQCSSFFSAFTDRIKFIFLHNWCVFLMLFQIPLYFRGYTFAICFNCHTGLRNINFFACSQTFLLIFFVAIRSDTPEDWK